MTERGDIGRWQCDHKCHAVGLNPWVKECPVCGCPNKAYDSEAEVPMREISNGK